MLRLLPFVCLIVSTFAAAETLQSPDGRLRAEFSLEPSSGQLQYSLQMNGKPVILPSPISFEIAGQRTLGAGLSLESANEHGVDRVWRPLYGERDAIRNHYRELTLLYRETAAPHRRIELIARAYDAGLAFCYRFLPGETLDAITIERERATFHFTRDHTAWATYSAQGLYEETTISQIKAGCERPLAIRVNDDLYIALAEARLVDFARMKLAPVEGDSPALVSELSSEAEVQLPYQTPWRVILAGDSPAALLENNDLIFNLNPPGAIEDPSWIRPGKVIREVSLTTDGGIACVDFAAEYNFQFVEYDAGWYGHEYDDASDATTIDVDPKRSPGPLDLQRVIDYAESKDVGVIVYVNRRALETQLDDILPLYQLWGLSGVKYGFVNVGSQEWTTWLHDAVRKAAKHELMVDIHDEYRPTGVSRTWPNLMTQEGIRGDEAKPSASQTLTTLFTRMLAGAGDNTVCYFDDRVTELWSHSFQLAKMVCFYSPWQFMFWYDRPAEITAEPMIEAEFIKAVPTVWNDTRVLDGAIGDFAAIARRSDDEWFVGIMNAGPTKQYELDFGFLDENQGYSAKFYSTDPSLMTRTRIAVKERRVQHSDIVRLSLPQNDGIAVWLTPEK